MGMHRESLEAADSSEASRCYYVSWKKPSEYCADLATQTDCQISYAARTQQSSGIEDIYVTKAGERWHKNHQCKHIRRHPAKLLTPCCDCTRG